VAFDCDVRVVKGFFVEGWCDVELYLVLLELATESRVAISCLLISCPLVEYFCGACILGVLFYFEPSFFVVWVVVVGVSDDGLRSKELEGLDEVVNCLGVVCDCCVLAFRLILKDVERVDSNP